LQPFSLTFANFDLPDIALNGLLTRAAGQVNGTASAGHNVDRLGVGIGVYSLGAPRQLEFGWPYLLAIVFTPCPGLEPVDSRSNGVLLDALGHRGA
jgi:hypothetical protein